MNRFFSLCAVAVLALALTLGNAIAGPGHDHGGEAAAMPAGPTSPRFDAHSDLFELVGVLEGAALSVFVDRFDDNVPVLKAKLELESGAIKATAEFHEDTGAYKFNAAGFTQPGSYPVVITVSAGDDVDILAGNLVVPDEHARNRAGSAAVSARLGMVAGALFVLLALVWAGRRLQKRRSAAGAK